ncbi:hypothetical protein ACFL6H_04970 [Candidatus Latescibacterota bacterium]
MKYLLTLLFIMLIIPSTCFAQAVDSPFSIFGGLAMPQGDFGDDDDLEDCGNAKTGFGAGINYTTQLTNPDLSWISSISFLMNGWDEDMLEEEWGEDTKIDAGSWINIPIMSGIKYQTSISPTMQIYLLGQGGLNIVKAPSLEASYYDDYDEEWYKDELEWDTGSSFGFTFGGGIVLTDKISIGLRYYSLGEPEIEGEYKSEDDDSEKIEWEGPISILLVMVEISF